MSILYPLSYVSCIQLYSMFQSRMKPLSIFISLLFHPEHISLELLRAKFTPRSLFVLRCITRHYNSEFL